MEDIIQKYQKQIDKKYGYNEGKRLYKLLNEKDDESIIKSKFDVANDWWKLKRLREIIPESSNIHSFEQLNNKLLYEGLILTVSSSETKRGLEKVGYRMDKDFRYDKNANTFCIYYDVSQVINNEKIELFYKKLKDLFTLMNNLRWFCSSVVETKQGEVEKKINIDKFDKTTFESILHFKRIKISFQAKYSQELKGKKKPKIAFHITTNLFIDKILKIGLAPKSKSKLGSHPSRIYLTKTLNDARQLSENLVFFDKNLSRISIVYILEINLIGFSGRIFRDDMATIQGAGISKDCIWTNNNISRNRIRIIEQENVEIV